MSSDDSATVDRDRTAAMSLGAARPMIIRSLGTSEQRAE